MTITITTKDISRVYEATSGRKAVQAFFDDLRAGKIDLEQVAILGSWHPPDNEEGIPFRIAPAAWRCGLITQAQAVGAFEEADLFFTPREIANMAEADAWMLREDDSILDSETVGE